MQLGFDVPLSFNCDFDRWIPVARGHAILVVAVGGDMPLPEKYWREFDGGDTAGLLEAAERSGVEVEQKTLPDGTQLTVVVARDAETLQDALGRIDLRQEPP